MAFIPADARWYLAEVVLEHLIEGDPRNVVHINTCLLEAGSPAQAYDKALALGKGKELEYANTEGKLVRVVFRGLKDLLVIYDELGDGAELTYSEEIGVPEDRLKSWIAPKEDLGVFADVERSDDYPNYMPDEVARMLIEKREAGDRTEGEPDVGKASDLT